VKLFDPESPDPVRIGSDYSPKLVTANRPYPPGNDPFENIKKRLEWCWYEKQHGEGKFYYYDREIDILEIIINAAEWKEEKL